MPSACNFNKSYSFLVIAFFIVGIGSVFAVPPYEHNAGTVVSDVWARGDIQTLYFPKGDDQKSLLHSASILFGADNNFARTAVSAKAKSGNVFSENTSKNSSDSEFLEPAGASSEKSTIHLTTSYDNISGNIEMTQVTYTYDDSFDGLDGLLEMEVYITNKTSKTYFNTYGGAYFDFDVSNNDNVGYDSSRGMYYQYNTETQTYIGFGISSGKIHSAHFQFYDLSSITYESISDGVQDEFLTTFGGDTVFTVSEKTGVLGAGQTIKFVVALMVAKSLEELQGMYDYSKINRGAGKAVKGSNVTGLQYNSEQGAPPIAQHVVDSSQGGGGCILKRRKN